MTERLLVGRSVLGVQVRLPKLLRDSPLSDPAVLLGATVVGARRRAKILVIDFSNGLSLMIHFKLSGQWVIDSPDGREMAGHPVPTPASALPHRTTHATITFTDDVTVHYSDIRQFGWWRILPAEAVDETLDAFGFGPEGTDLESEVRRLADKLATRSIPIKTLLLDQAVVAGLGNIYVDEVLWRARIHPMTPASAVSTVKRREIVRTIPHVLAEGIRQGGAKIVHNTAYPIDGFPAVHAREGQPCPRCGTAIVKTRVGQRGTYLCPKCQKAPRVPRAEPNV